MFTCVALTFLLRLLLVSASSPLLNIQELRQLVQTTFPRAFEFPGISRVWLTEDQLSDETLSSCADHMSEWNDFGINVLSDE